MPPIDVADVGRVIQRISVARETGGLDLSVARRQLGRRRRRTIDPDRVPTNPLFGLLGKDHVRASPRDGVDRREGLVVWLVVPELVRLATAGRGRTAGDVGDHERNRISTREGGAIEAVDAPFPDPRTASAATP